MELGVALSGNLDFSGDDRGWRSASPATRMSVAAMKRLWPVVLAPKVRAWVTEHLVSGTVERIVIATNAPFDTLKRERPADSRRRPVDRRVDRHGHPAGRRACRRSATPT